MKNKIITLIICLIIPQLAGAIGSFATASNVDTWYATIAKPAFNPPNWIFGPVWTILFLLMGIALYFVLTAKSSPARAKAMWWFAIQLGLNVLWSFIFFGAHRVGLAFAEIIMLWLSILITIILFWKVRPLSAYLLVPYIAWVSFAAVLNFAIWQLY